MSLIQTSWLIYPATLDYAALASLQNVEVLAPYDVRGIKRNDSNCR